MKKLIYSKEDLDLILSLELEEYKEIEKTLNKECDQKDKEIERLNNMLENDSTKNLELIELINKIRDVAEDHNITSVEARLKILEILEN